MAIRRKRGGRRRLRRRRSIIARPFSNQKARFRCKILAVADIVVLGAVGVTNTRCNIMLNYPTMIKNEAATYVQIANGNPFDNVSISATWPRLIGGAALFDAYRVRGLRVRFHPESTSTNLITAAYPTYVNPQIIYHSNDIDDTVLLQNEAQALNQGIMGKSFASAVKPLNFYFKNPDRKTWFNGGSYALNEGVAPATNQAVAPANSWGSMKFMFTVSVGAAAVAALGRMYIEWDCEFKSIATQL